jgi:phosphotransferase system HPr-like phosphotransfer protein
MAKKFTKTIKGFTEKGFYNPETQTITSSKDGEETNILHILNLLSRDGQEISISAKQEDTIEDIEE